MSGGVGNAYQSGEGATGIGPFKECRHGKADVRTRRGLRPPPSMPNATHLDSAASTLLVKHALMHRFKAY